jgi:hypothetical protein
VTTADRTGRFAWIAAIAWISMVGVLAVMAGVRWNLPGFRDPDISGPVEMALTFAIVSAIPFAILAAVVLAPAAWIADRLIRGRLPAGANIVIGALFAIPSILAFLIGNWVLFGRRLGFGEYVDRVRNPPDSLIGLLIVFAVGGVIMSLGMRRRTAL